MSITRRVSILYLLVIVVVIHAFTGGGPWRSRPPTRASTHRTAPGKQGGRTFEIPAADVTFIASVISAAFLWTGTAYPADAIVGPAPVPRWVYSKEKSPDRQKPTAPSEIIPKLPLKQTPKEDRVDPTTSRSNVDKSLTLAVDAARVKFASGSAAEPAPIPYSQPQQIPLETLSILLFTASTAALLNKGRVWYNITSFEDLENRLDMAVTNLNLPDSITASDEANILAVSQAAIAKNDNKLGTVEETENGIQRLPAVERSNIVATTVTAVPLNGERSKTPGAPPQQRQRPFGAPAVRDPPVTKTVDVVPPKARKVPVQMKQSTTTDPTSKNRPQQVVAGSIVKERPPSPVSAPAVTERKGANAIESRPRPVKQQVLVTSPKLPKRRSENERGVAKVDASSPGVVLGFVSYDDSIETSITPTEKVPISLKQDNLSIEEKAPVVLVEEVMSRQGDTVVAVAPLATQIAPLDGNERKEKGLWESASTMVNSIFGAAADSVSASAPGKQLGEITDDQLISLALTTLTSDLQKDKEKLSSQILKLEKDLGSLRRNSETWMMRAVELEKENKNLKQEIVRLRSRGNLSPSQIKRELLELLIPVQTALATAPVRRKGLLGRARDRVANLLS